MRIHKEGYKLIPLMALLVGGLFALLYWLIPFPIVQVILGIAAFIFMVLVVRFFRDPVVVTPPKEGIVYAPAEGKVVVIEKVFDPFFSTKDIGKGTGLGLSLSYSLIKSNKGLLTLNREAKNTCFEFTLPLAKEKE